MKNMNVLIVEDHPIMVKNYITSIKYVEKLNEGELFFNCNSVANCKEANDVLVEYVDKQFKLDLVILDISIPPDSKSGFISGEDIGVFIKEKYPETKIIICTSLENNFRLSSLLSVILPDGVLIKSEISGDDIIASVRGVIEGKKVYSPRISKIIDNLISNSNDKFEEIDRKILYELSMASRLVDMVKILNISRATIELRKKRMKEILDVETDRELLEEARRQGFI